MKENIEAIGKRKIDDETSLNDENEVIIKKFKPKRDSSNKNALKEITNNDENRARMDAELCERLNCDANEKCSPFSSINSSKVKTSSLAARMSSNCLEKLIGETQRPVVDAICGEAVELPLCPGLFIENYGDVSLPLARIDAFSSHQFISSSDLGTKVKSLAHFVYQSYSSTNESKNKFEIEASMVKINNPKWHSKLKQLAQRVSLGLGVVEKVEAKLRKVLVHGPGNPVCEEDSIVNTTEKNMFAKLYIQLPSIYQGGEMVVHCQDQQNKIIDFENKTKSSHSPYSIQFAALYADLNHKFLSVKSGIRLILVYSLCCANSVQWDYVNEKRSRIGQISAHFNELFKSSKNKFAGMLLDDSYRVDDFKSLGKQAFTGNDCDRFDLLNIVNDRFPLHEEEKMAFSVVEANLKIDYYSVKDSALRLKSKTYTSFEENDETDWEVDKRSPATIKNWYDLSGSSFGFKEKSNHVKLDFLEKVIDPNWIEDDPAPQVDLNQDTQLWGREKHISINGFPKLTKEIICSKFVLLMCPKSSEFQSILEIDISYGLKSLKRSLESKNKVEFEANLNVFCDYYTVKKTPKISIDEKESIEAFLYLTKKSHSVRLCKLFLNSLPVESNTDWLAEFIKRFGWKDLGTELDRFLFPININASKNCHLVKQLISLKQVEIAFECFKYCIAPILIEKRELINSFKLQFQTHSQVQNNSSLHKKKSGLKRKSNIDPSSYNAEKNLYYQLAEVMLLLRKANKTVDEYMSKYVENIKCIEEDALRDLLDQIVGNKAIHNNMLFGSSKEIEELFLIRHFWLIEKLKNPPDFSWSFKSKLEDHPDLDSFFESKEKTTTYSSFKTIEHARCFAKLHNGIENGHSLKIELVVASGGDKDFHVKIHKTKELYEEEISMFDKFKVELTKIENHMKAFGIKFD